MRVAKTLLIESTRNMQRSHNHPLKAMEKTKDITQNAINQEIENIIKNVESTKNAQRETEKQNEDELLDSFIKRGFFRQKSGILKENKFIKFYHDESEDH